MFGSFGNGKPIILAPDHMILNLEAGPPPRAIQQGQTQQIEYVFDKGLPQHLMT